jgi:transcriptional regulator with AAA-type ATPase domain
MDMEFFKMVSEAAFSNPFSDKRVEIDRRIVGASESSGWHEMHEPLLHALGKNIHDFSSSSETMADLRESLKHPDLNDDTRAVAVSILFFVFHHYMDRFDTLYYFISKGLIGDSMCMKRMRAQLWDNIFTHDISWYVRCLWNRMEDFSTLLLGETGTGKGAAAAAIGRSGFIPFNPNAQKFEESFTRAFVAINLSQYPESLIESELFGHRKGAFTGAIDKHDGIFARCSPYGAIFLDELGDVSVPVQIKLLQVLQERTFSPVGSHDKLRFKGRVIAATNKSIDALRREGSFRDDFYYRLCSDLITVPPLRQRIREMPRELEMLATHLMQRICGSQLRSPVVGKLKADIGKNYAWPGNVRELEQAIRCILLTGTYEDDAGTEPGKKVALGQAVENGSLTAKELVEKYCRDLYNTYGNYGEVARRTGLDWRTVKKNVMSGE